ncbi:MAG: hypothetical protein AB1656_00075 [Candidatus Omnitrophota bacterium]
MKGVPRALFMGLVGLITAFGADLSANPPLKGPYGETILGWGTIYDGDIAPGGESFVLGTSLGAIEWNAKSGDFRAFQPIGDLPARAVAYSPDGSKLLASDWNASRIWSAETRELLLSFPAKLEPGSSICVSQDEQYAAACNYDKSNYSYNCNFWNLSSGDQSGIIGNISLNSNLAAFVSNFGFKMASVDSLDNPLIFWNMDVLPSEKRSKPSITPFASVQTPDRSLAAARVLEFNTVNDAGESKIVAYVWETSAWNQLLKIEESENIEGVAFDPESRAIIVLTKTQIVSIDSQTGVELSRREIPASFLKINALSQDGKWMLIQKDELTLEYWNLEKMELVFSAPLITDDMKCAAFDPSGKIVCAAQDSRLTFYDADSGDFIEEWPGGNPKTIQSIAYSPDGTKLAAAKDNGIVEVWDVQEKTILWDNKSLEGFVDGVISFSQDGQRILISGGEDISEISSIWNAETGEKISTLTVLDFPTPKTLSRMNPDGDPNSTVSPMWGYLTISRAVFSPNEELIVTNRTNYRNRNTYSIGIWDAKTGKLLLVLDKYSGFVTQIRFSHDGRSIVIGDDLGKVVVCNVETGKEALVCQHDYSFINDAVFTPDDRYILSTAENLILWESSGESKLIVWNAATGERLLKLDPFNSAIKSIDFSSDGKRFVTAADDGHARIWNMVDVEEMIRTGIEDSYIYN